MSTFTPATATAGPDRPARALSPALSEFAYWMTYYRRTWRGTIVLSVLNPLLFFIGIGVGLGRLIDRNPAAPLHHVSYLAFLAPGLLAAMAMQTGTIESVMSVYLSLRTRGNYRVAALTTLSPADILNGHLLFVLFRIATSSAAFLVVLLCARLAASPLVVLALPAAVLTGLAFAIPFMALGVSVTNEETVRGVYRFVIMPLYLFSGTYVAVNQLPAVIRPVAYALPLWHGVQLCRGLSLGTLSPGGALLHTGYLCAVCAVGLITARAMYRRHLHD
jgi:lipooligosaccharide transport system permease protein